MRRVCWLLVGAVLMALLGSGCSAGAQGITVEDPWVRGSLVQGGNGAGYMVIRNGGPGDDALIGARSDIADAAEVHQTVQMEGDMMGMQPVERIDIPAGEHIALEPGGYHIMFMGTHGGVAPGDVVAITLIFEQAGEVQVQAEVRAE